MTTVATINTGDGVHTSAQRPYPDDAILLRDADAGRVLGIGKTKVRELIASGELRSVRIGRRLLVPRPAIADYIERLLEGESQ